MSDPRFVPQFPTDKWWDEKCPSEFDNHFHLCGLYRGHDGPHRCVAKVDNQTWTDDEEDKGPFVPDEY